MEIAYDSSDLARNKALIGVLSKFSPTDIIKSKELKTSFKDFFARGTVEDCLQLFQWVPKVPLSDTRRHKGLSDTISSKLSLSLLNDVPSPNDPSSCGTSRSTLLSTAPVLNTLASKPITCLPSAGSKTCIPRPPPTPDAPLSNPGNSIVKYFKEKGIGSDRIKRLTQQTLSFVNAEVLPQESYDNLWSAKGKIFAGSESGMRRTCRLQRGRLQIEECSSQYGIAARHCLMFTVAEIAHYAHTATPAELGLRPHRNRMTAALEKIAKVNNISKENLHQDKRKSRNYFEMLFGPGPGSLLVIGSEAASWEVSTNKEAVRLVLEYIETHLPGIYSTLISLNGVGAHTMVEGLLAYGWTEEEVKSSPIPFIKAVRKYLDKNLKIPIAEGGVLTTQHPHTKNQSSKKRVGDEIRTGNTKEDHAYKLHTSNQSSSAFDDQTAETSPTHGLGVEHPRPSPNPNPNPSITADSNPPDRLAFTGLERPAATDASANDILDDVTTRHTEDDGIDPWMAGTLRSCADSTESWLLANRLQNSDSSGLGQRQAVSMDPYMTSSLCAVDCLPSSLEQDLSRERAFTIDPNMMSTLGAVGGLPSSLEPSSSRERVLTINPNLLTIDPSMTSSLGAVDCLPLWSKIQVGRGCSQYIET